MEIQPRLKGGGGAVGRGGDQLAQLLGTGIPRGEDPGQRRAAVAAGLEIAVCVQLQGAGRRPRCRG